jgi:hypothetical protein
MPTHAPDSPPPDQRRVILFQERAIRPSWHENEWRVSVVDVCAVLTGSVGASAYWRKPKQRLLAESGQPVTFRHGSRLTATNSRQRVTECANTEGHSASSGPSRRRHYTGRAQVWPRRSED